MILFKKAKSLNNYLQKLRNKSISIGFVPTMGALHNGHISLIKSAKQKCDVVVCSIFINPTQFNNKNDFYKYPVTIDNDILLLETNGTDVLFFPSVNEIYPDGTENLIQFKLGYLENILEGYYRPGHFQGVCNVMHKLLDIIKPDILILGQKDYQQVLVLKKMMHSFHPNIHVVVEEIVRESNGLAMSSRNTRLNNNSRKKATAIYKALQYIKHNIGKISFEELKKNAAEIILSNGFDKIDYIEISDAKTLQTLNNFIIDNKLIALAAAFINDVRLIDNILL